MKRAFLFLVAIPYLIAAVAVFTRPDEVLKVRTAQAQYAPSVATIDSGKFQSGIWTIIQYSNVFFRGVTAGTSKAYKALVLGATKNVDSLRVDYLAATSFTGSNSVQPVSLSPAAAETLYASGTYHTSGTVWIGRPLAAKSTVLLQTGHAVGDWAMFIVADTDTLRFRAAAGDSIITTDGSADIVYGSVAGSCRVVYGKANKWFIMSPIGTWTASHN